MLTSWSPPASLKASGKEKCHGNLDCTLKKKKNGKFVYEEFADWWLESLKHYQEKGLTPYYISMQNEPSFIPPDWEGCKFEPKET
jgi:O-glycosyl hydrolase